MKTITTVMMKVGAGTGRYSVTLAKQGYRVTAVERIKLIATDGATNYKREYIDAMDDDTFAKWMDYHFTICERPDLIGASHHTLDIIQKI